MQINIPPDDHAKLIQHAMAAGYGDVERYVTDFVLCLAEHSQSIDLFEPLTEQELTESLGMLDLGLKQIQTGQVLSVDQARVRSLDAMTKHR